MKRNVLIKTDEEMQKLGYEIGSNAFPNMVITMEGDLGAGKTTMTKGIGKALDVQRIINSPTFTIMKIYEGKMPLYHMDVYRINNNSGDDYLQEYFEMDGVCVIEWANNISEFLPDKRLKIDIIIDKDFNRMVSIEAIDCFEYDKVIENINMGIKI